MRYRYAPLQRSRKAKAAAHSETAVPAKSETQTAPQPAQLDNPYRRFFTKQKTLQDLARIAKDTGEHTGNQKIK